MFIQKEGFECFRPLAYYGCWKVKEQISEKNEIGNSSDVASLLRAVYGVRVYGYGSCPTSYKLRLYPSSSSTVPLRDILSHLESKSVQ